MKQHLIFALSILFFLCSCQPKDTKWQGQEPIQKVSTLTRPIQYQLKKTFDVGNGIFLSNEFDGARLNGVALTGENEVTVLITPENTPINESPWYAFKIWSDTEKEILLKITYNEGFGHRYYPKISTDGKNWIPIDSTVYLADTASVARGESPNFCEFTLAINSDTTWIAAQELIVSKDIYEWAGVLAEKSHVSLDALGKSKEGRSIKYLQIGNPESKKMLMVLSRQHPPEVTGWLAMKAFTEELCATNALSKKFRDEYCIYVVPCVNPDGVDNGHWRHGAGGIDLNRDWEDFNQSETQAVRKFMQDKVAEQRKFYFIIDFHSTYEDIYYTIAPELKGNMPGIVPKIIQAMAEDIPGYDPNIRPNAADVERINSTVSIFHEFGAEAVTYEVGDDTPRELIRKKGEFTAINLMKIMLED
ncbi:M14 family metallopeptidase [Draconibacterium mangrovi]|uniref:M14 family metallopeptidase n=1 Tax=Draconibacterium mangrovi TaxID=2697469 RepID=UPI0013D341F2|nr:M14 family metallopeptidase [Draconibacterium mangrovi]